jgi:periplasmic divalent cation tolerance protein
VEKYVQALTTVSSADEGARLARSIIGARLAACVQIVGPIRSIYWWREAIDEAEEWQLLMKTTADRLQELEAHIKENHAYDTPEIIVTPIIGGSAEYMSWISEETKRTDAS